MRRACAAGLTDLLFVEESFGLGEVGVGFGLFANLLITVAPAAVRLSRVWLEANHLGIVGNRLLVLAL